MRLHRTRFAFPAVVIPRHRNRARSTRAAVWSRAGISLADMAPHQALPQDIVELSWIGKLGYVGHLI